MQTCKELRISYSYWDYVNSVAAGKTVHLLIPPGIYVKNISGRIGKLQNRKYRIKPWKGMDKEYKQVINQGIVISHSQVKGLFI